MTTELIGHQSVEIWMGETVLTLVDLIPDTPRAVLVGINPAPPSVAVGHYYQGRAGRRILSRLRSAGLLPAEPVGFDDDDAHRHGIGFTDIIKRPSAAASELHPDEFRHGRPLLADRLDAARAGLVIFSFKKAATAYFGNFAGGGLLDGLSIADAAVFVMPGPMEGVASAAQKMATLREHLAR